MRQKCGDVVGSMGRQSIEDVFAVHVRIVTVELRGADQAHDRSGALAGAQRTCEQPVRPKAKGRIWFSSQLCRLPDYAASCMRVAVGMAFHDRCVRIKV